MAMELYEKILAAILGVGERERTDTSTPALLLEEKGAFF
jgi:hypothetical protein